MSIAIEFLKPRIAGFNVIDCEVKSADVVYLLTREDYTQRADWDETEDPPVDTELTHRVLGARLDGPDDKRWGAINLTGMDRSQCAMAYTPEGKLAVVDVMSAAWVQKNAGSGFEPEIPGKVDGGLNRGGLTRARSFGGNVIIANNARQLFERVAPNTWQLIGPSIDIDPSETPGFRDFDRFGPADWYAAGGHGDVWRFDGNAWHRCKFPTNLGPTAVCCAGDGHVYIMASTSLYRGRGDKWEAVGEPIPLTIPIKDLVWYEDRLWGTNDYGVWVLKDGQLVEAELPSEVKICAGNLAVRDGVMLLAGYGGAAYKRDGKWNSIFLDFEVREWFETNRDKVWTPPK